RLTFRGLTDQPFTVRREGDDRRRRAQALGILDDFRSAAIHHRDTRIRRAEVDADYFSHLNDPRLCGRPGGPHYPVGTRGKLGVWRMSATRARSGPYGVHLETGQGVGTGWGVYRFGCERPQAVMRQFSHSLEKARRRWFTGRGCGRTERAHESGAD